MDQISGCVISHLLLGPAPDQAEVFWGKAGSPEIQRDLIARGVFTSKTDLRRKIMSYIRRHNRDCHPFHWTYRNTKRRIRVNVS